MEKTPQRGKAQKAYGRKIVQNASEKSIKTDAEIDEERYSKHAESKAQSAAQVYITGLFFK